MNTRIFIIIFASSFGLLIAGAIIGNILESNGTLEEFGPDGITAVKLLYFALFCILCFSLVPLLIKYFISGQIYIGNRELFLIKWIQTHEKGIIYGFWTMLVIGLCIGVPAAIKDGFFK